MTGTATSNDERRLLRRELRARRRAIQGEARRRKALAVVRQVKAARLLKAGSRVAVFLSMPEEIDTAPLLALARALRCHVAVPRIVGMRQGRMRFFELSRQVGRGSFGILEPRGGRMVPARMLDVVFMPLVGFDARGNRMGMGRGYYDRHFAYRLRLPHWRRPLLVGIAYDAQEVPRLPAAAHDVPIDAIVTESSTRRFHRSPSR